MSAAPFITDAVAERAASGASLFLASERRNVGVSRKVTLDVHVACPLGRALSRQFKEDRRTFYRQKLAVVRVELKSSFVLVLTTLPERVSGRDLAKAMRATIAAKLPEREIPAFNRLALVDDLQRHLPLAMSATVTSRVPALSGAVARLSLS